MIFLYTRYILIGKRPLIVIYDEIFVGDIQRELHLKTKSNSDDDDNDLIKRKRKILDLDTKPSNTLIRFRNTEKILKITNGWKFHKILERDIIKTQKNKDDYDELIEDCVL